MENDLFSTEPGFCPDCGTILPNLKSTGVVKCYVCSKEFGPEVFGNMEMHYTVTFNSLDKFVSTGKNEDLEQDGPTIERKCPMCNNDKMSYATLQLRSADEGQTVFYTCTKCKYKETENS